jgi:DNA-directed RNA polymerase subunit E'/Rpb7
MESLAQIFSFSHYFINKEIKNDEKGIAFEFKDYMENLWKDNSEMFTPMKFIKKLIKMNKKQFSLKEELDPYIFYNYILNQLNNELNDKDKDIKKYFENFNKKYLENKEIEGNNDLKDYIKQFSEKNNSIVSKTFYGLYKIIENCNYCRQEEKIKYEKFNVIDIDLYEFFNYIYEKGDSITTVYFDDILDYFFREIITMEKVKCKDKGMYEKIIQIKIIEIPNYLIFRLKFDESKKENFMKKSYKFIDINDTIEIKKEYFDEDIAYNKNNLITDSVKYQLFSTIDYWEKSKKYICKYKIKENNKTNKWYSFWCNSEGKEVGTYKDDFTSPCMLFYEKI